MSGTTTSSTSRYAIPSWSDLVTLSESNPVGQALKAEVELRKEGHGSAHVQNRIRKFQSKVDPKITLFRDHAGWCPYCQKTMLLIEEKEVPIKIDLVPMRAYGDKPREFLQKVPNGLLPAIELEDGQIITESQVIMECLDNWHPPSKGYKPMVPQSLIDRQRYDSLCRLERELFSWWCSLVFRPEGPSIGRFVVANPFSSSSKDKLSGAMKGFLDCLQKVNDELESTPGPWFFSNEDYDRPTMIDFIYVSHVERMLASCAFWKGLNIRDPKWNLSGLSAWLEAFEKRESYLAFKSDYFTHVLDIPPQYGPGYSGGFEEDRQEMSRNIIGKDGSWNLPLNFDDALQPLYKGPPLPLCVLEAMQLEPNPNDGTYQQCDANIMARACRYMAAWKLAGNGVNVANFAARGGPDGSQNPRKTFGAQLADPYAQSDETVKPHVDAALRMVVNVLLSSSSDNAIDPPSREEEEMLQNTIPANQVEGVKSSLAYLRDRVGVPRDLPLASARYLRAYLNWAIDTL